MILMPLEVMINAHARFFLHRLRSVTPTPPDPNMEGLGPHFMKLVERWLALNENFMCILVIRSQPICRWLAMGYAPSILCKIRWPGPIWAGNGCRWSLGHSFEGIINGQRLGNGRWSTPSAVIKPGCLMRRPSGSRGVSSADCSVKATSRSDRLSL